MKRGSGEHIEMRPSANHGEKACIVGSRIRVLDVYVWHELRGMSVHEIVDQFPQLTPADIHAAMAYYWDHREEIQQQLRRGREIAEEFRKEHSPMLPPLQSDLGADADPVSS